MMEIQGASPNISALRLERLNVLGFLVEGEHKGSSLSADELSLFTSPAGETPNYPLAVDQDWRNFLALAPPQGKQLPLLAHEETMGGELQPRLEIEFGAERILEVRTTSLSDGGFVKTLSDEEYETQPLRRRRPYY